jgi:YD repeat-containing protein
MEVEPNEDFHLTLAYNSNGALKEQTYGSGTNFKQTVNGWGLVTHEENPAVGSIDYAYNGEGQLVEVNVNGRETTILRNAKGNPTSIVSPGYRATMEYKDALGINKGLLCSQRTTPINLSAGSPPEWRVETFDYDALGNVVRHTVPLGDGLVKTTAFEHDLAGRTVAMTNPDGVTRILSRDANGNLSGDVWPTNRGSVGFDYSPTSGRLLTKTVAGATEYGLVYDDADRLTGAIWSGERSYTFNYRDRVSNGQTPFLQTITDNAHSLGGAATIELTPRADGFHARSANK